jgi:amino acid adenylation domain-containing protein
MEVSTIIDELIRLGISIRVSEGNLVIKGGAREIPGHILSLLKERKPAIIAYLLAENTKGHQSRFIPVAMEEDGYPLSSSQSRLWILSQMEEASIAYNTPGTYIFEGDLNIVALQSSFKILIARHESLRTIFRENSKQQLRQFILPAETDQFKLGYVNLILEKNADEQLMKILQMQQEGVFDLENGPLIRATLICMADGRFVFNYVLHHIIADGWSMDILIRELISCYNGKLKGQDIQLDPLRIQYKDYASWQQKELAAGNQQHHKAYWLEQFNGDLPVLELMGDRLRPLTKTYHGATKGRYFDEALMDKFRMLLPGQNATLFMGLLAVVNALLYRYSAQTDLILGTQIAGREHPDLEGQIGCYLNTLALRTRFSEKDSFNVLLGKVKKITLEAYEHQSYPFDDLVDSLNIIFNPSRNPLFDVSVVLQHTGSTGSTEKQETAHLGELAVTNYSEVENVISKFDLAFDFTELGKGLLVNIVYNTDIFNADTIGQLLQHLEQLMTAVAIDPGITLAKLSYLSQEEQVHILEHFNATKLAYPKDKTIASLFEEQVKLHPDHIALIFEEHTLTYSELDKQSARLAAYLQDTCMVGVGQSVGIMLDRSEKYIIAILGILRSGGAYVPVDPDYPVSRKEFIFQDAEIQVLITQTEYIFDLDYYSGHVFAIDVQLQSLEPASSVPLKNTVNDLAYIMYTSGSTGMPKGVMVEQRGVIRLVKSMNYVHVAVGDRILSMSNFSFDGSVFDIFASLLNGAALVITRKEQLLDFMQLSTIITGQQISVFFITTALFNALADSAFLTEHHLKYILFGGERVSVGHVKRFKNKHPLVNLVHVYGPTENTTFSSYYPIKKVDEHLGTIPIGKPISNATCFIFNGEEDTLTLVPIGVVGEICVGGDGLARGYLNRPELTMEKFVTNPFPPGERIYRTGDLGRWLADGSIEFIGRRDKQVKIRGHRIELGEIESALLEHPDIEAAVVTDKTTDTGLKELVAYVVSSSILNVTDIRSFLGEQLPTYMLPAQYARLAAFPLNSSGKVDKQKLELLGEELLATGTTYIPPVTDTECKLVKIWEEILGKSNIGLKDDYFELGGSSLMAIIMIKKIADEFGITIPVKVLFTGKNIESIITFMESMELVTTHSPEPIPAVTTDLQEISYTQKNYFCDWQFGSDLVVKAYFYENLNLDCFEKAVNQLLERHEVLRTIFKLINGKLFQQVLPLAAFGFKLEQIKIIAGNAFNLDDAIAQESQRVIDPLDQKLVFVKVYQLKDDSCYVIVTLHHILTDGYSTGIFQSELSSLYTGAVNGLPVVLKDMHHQYSDFSRWQHAFVNSAVGLEHRSYWLKRLKGFDPGLQIPVSGVATGSLGIQVAIEGALEIEMTTFLKRNALTMPILLMGIWRLLLWRSYKQQDITIFTTVSGRNSKYYGTLDVSNMIGLFAAPLMTRFQLDNHKPLSVFFEEIRDNFLEDLSFDTYPVMKLIDELPDINKANLLNTAVFFNYHNYAYLKETADYSVIETGVRELPQLKGTLGIIAEDYANRLKLEFIFNASFFNRDQVAELKTQYFMILKQVLQFPEITVHMLDENLKHEIISDLNT